MQSTLEGGGEGRGLRRASPAWMAGPRTGLPGTARLPDKGALGQAESETKSRLSPVQGGRVFQRPLAATAARRARAPGNPRPAQDSFSPPPPGNYFSFFPFRFLSQHFFFSFCFFFFFGTAFHPRSRVSATSPSGWEPDRAPRGWRLHAQGAPCCPSDRAVCVCVCVRVCVSNVSVRTTGKQRLRGQG